MVQRNGKPISDVRAKDAVSRAESITTRTFNQDTLELVTISKALRAALKSRQAAVGQSNAPKVLSGRLSFCLAS
ncbi:hypothetical protein FOPG_03571 [Fusarium oxysporum f. sp. conglutinans race 2 54008]|uniref:Uncharacterized protein n=1 Tax=Fusarium oxysporum f. sp. conglutinans race 2 54008 TaxID=1089457 RepID=X0IIR4_FUSOX|nr:hypothetical protein FOPG_03571 [Fusarium oxysporum f. sp. conglutinans race 2 54008]